MPGSLHPHQELAAHLPPPWARRRACGDGVRSQNRGAKNLITVFVPSLHWRGDGPERGICEHRLPPLSSMSHGAGWEVRGGREGGRYPLLVLCGVRGAGGWRQSRWGK